MPQIYEFFKRTYEQLYDLPHFYLEIENELYCHIFTIFFTLALFLGFAYITKLLLGFIKSSKKRKKIRKKMDIMILGVLEDKDKNKKNI
jgi:hypothetical protein